MCGLVADIDWDGVNEIVIGTYGKRLLIYKCTTIIGITVCVTVDLIMYHYKTCPALNMRLFNLKQVFFCLLSILIFQDLNTGIYRLQRRTPVVEIDGQVA